MHFNAAAAALLEPSPLEPPPGKMAPKRRAPKRRAQRPEPTCEHPGCNEPAEPNCSCPSCGRDHRVTSLDFLEELDSPLVCIMRDNRILAVGKFSDSTIQALCRPGDQLLDQAGGTWTYSPPSSSSFQGEAHKL